MAARAGDAVAGAVASIVGTVEVWARVAPGLAMLIVAPEAATSKLGCVRVAPLTLSDDCRETKAADAPGCGLTDVLGAEFVATFAAVVITLGSWLAEPLAGEGIGEFAD